MATKRTKKQTAEAVDKKGKDFLTEGEMKRLLDAAKGSRYGQRDYLMLLMAYRHGLRVSGIIDLRLKDVELDTSRLYARRKKGSLSTHQPIEGDELRALRAWLRERSLRQDARSPYLFRVRMSSPISPVQRLYRSTHKLFFRPPPSTA